MLEVRVNRLIAKHLINSCAVKRLREERATQSKGMRSWLTKSQSLLMSDTMAYERKSSTMCTACSAKADPRLPRLEPQNLRLDELLLQVTNYEEMLATKRSMPSFMLMLPTKKQHMVVEPCTGSFKRDQISLLDIESMSCKHRKYSC